MKAKILRILPTSRSHSNIQFNNIHASYIPCQSSTYSEVNLPIGRSPSQMSRTQKHDDPNWTSEDCET
ncbi:hypothetical protein J6590_066479 [Homalodisca vitripennis]|nr:hypothetical protein J6590_066479 [Homalodisca vitripennis]